MASFDQVCAACGKPATTRVTKINNFNSVVAVYLCDEHAQAARPFLKKGEPLNLVELLQHFFQQDKITEMAGGKKPGGPSCGNCGLSFNDFRKTFLLGCSDCYTHFEKLLLPSLRKVHGTTHHDPLYEVETEKAGAVIEEIEEAAPEEAAAQHAPEPATPAKLSAEKLQEELQQAIANEDFERAALLRDQIRELTEPEGS